MKIKNIPQNIPGKLLRCSGKFLALGILLAGMTSGNRTLCQAETTFYQSTEDHDYLADLNAPILRITAQNKSYETFYQAWMSLELGDPRAPISRETLRFGTTMLEDAKAWVAEPSQRAAIDSILQADGLNPNVTFRQIFGLPYGSRNIPTEMDSNGFAVYINGGLLSEADFAYLPLLEQVILTLYVEAHYQAAQNNLTGSIDALVASLRLGRQLCDRAFATEMATGMAMVTDSMMEIREFMWHYRERLPAGDYKKIAEELEFMELDQIKPPRGHEIMGQQLIARIFGHEDFRPDRSTFAQTMARFESRKNPLRRFSATSKWGDLLSQHATYNETVKETANVAGDIRLRWRFNFNDPGFTRTPEIDRISSIKYAIPRAIYRGISDLFPIRHQMVVLQQGVICAAGVAGYQKREGGELIFDGKTAKGAPAALKQIQPAIVLSEEMLKDPHSTRGERMRYFVVTNRESTRITTMKTWDISTSYGRVTLVEGWPVLYSIGWDGDDDQARNHTEQRSADGDFIFWPPVEVIARDQQK